MIGICSTAELLDYPRNDAHSAAFLPSEARHLLSVVMYTILGSDQQQYGPVDHAGVLQWIQNGQANAQTMVFKQGEAEWKPLSAFPEFSGALSGGVGAQPGAPLVVAPPTQVPKVFGILNILFGLVCGTCTGVATAGIIALIALASSAGVDMGVWKIVWPGLMGLIVVLYLVLVVGGIGLLMSKAWGRTLSVAYSFGAIALSLISLVLSLFVIPSALSGGAVTADGVASAQDIVSTVIGLIYPVVLLIFMNKPEVKAALK